MRLLITTLLLALCLTGCNPLGRGAVHHKSVKIDAPWVRSMALPYWGGKVTRVDSSIVVVQYPKKNQSDRQWLAKEYHKSMVSNGYRKTQTSGDLVHSGTLNSSYSKKSGSRALLHVEQQRKGLKVSIRRIAKMGKR